MLNGKRIYVYVDGESHYIRNEDKAKKLEGFTSLGRVQRTGNSQGHDLAVRDDCHFIWDSEYLQQLYPDRRVYFTAYTGNDAGFHDAHVFLRQKQFEPFIIKEDKGLRERRKSKLTDTGVIEKPKGADIALTVRMIEDAVNDNYDVVGLFTWTPITYLSSKRFVGWGSTSSFTVSKRTWAIQNSNTPPTSSLTWAITGSKTVTKRSRPDPFVERWLPPHASGECDAVRRRLERSRTPASAAFVSHPVS